MNIIDEYFCRYFLCLFFTLCVIIDGNSQSVTSEGDRILPAEWNPKQEADQILKHLVNVCIPEVKGAHDADMVIVDGKAYITYMANDIQPSENPEWDFIYLALSIVDINSFEVEKVINFASSGKTYENNQLPYGACFGNRIVQKDNKILRCFFASEDPGERQSQTWYIDFDLTKGEFRKKIHKAKLKTRKGKFDLQPVHFYNDAKESGFMGKKPDYGLYPFDIKLINNKYYTAVSVFPYGPVAFAELNGKMNSFEILGYYFTPQDFILNESAFQLTPDGTWMAISRQEFGTRNYTFSYSKDGINWSDNKYLDVVSTGTNSKPVFEKFNDLYYLGWQDSAKVNGVSRSVYNIEVSTDCKNWERKYRFETERSFQYPTLFKFRGTVYVAITQGDTHESRKERIMFGKLE